jgi:exodeoxyribonuclease V alpha subunit
VALDRFRVLCALRQGPLGAEAVGRLIEARLRSAGALGDGGRQYDGRPILITANDAALQLQNGDTGVIVSTPRGLRAAFRDPSGGVRELLPGRLPPHETAFAMTVHKSQGSEFDHVVVVLPDLPSPLLTRELLYTGLTRAKLGVTVYTSPDRLHEAVATRVTRRSGLAARLGRSAC